MKQLKNLLFFMVSVSLITGCSPKEKPSVQSDNPVKEDYPHVETMEERDEKLKDWPFPGANGNWVPSRDGLENCDTIVNGFPYNRVY